MKSQRVRSLIFMLAATLLFAGGAHAGKAVDDGKKKECEKFPATGQTTCFDSSALVTAISCAGTGQDGEIRAGAVLSYTDNGNGTITDNNTRLMWEKKSYDGSIHDKDAIYTYADAYAVHVASLNQIRFAGHTGWRLPNVKELQSIVDYENQTPAVAPAFNTGCILGATVITGSCTRWDGTYWTSTTGVTHSPSAAWGVNFVAGDVYNTFKVYGNSMLHVRAVRGG